MRFGSEHRDRPIQRNGWRAVVGLTLTATIAIAACASGHGTIERHDYVTFTNSSPDVVRVYLRFADNDHRLGRWEAFEEKTVALPGGTIPAHAASLRILIVPVGARPISPGMEGVATTLSDFIAPEELLANGWSYSGNRIMALGPPRRN